ncbi:hypothetical protein ACFW61_18780 [Streptomyces microflavus]|uniref:hypothetical protein n=1 Tax=Streptomyces microflavus TaxID=1919 RepID=UPI003445AFB7
MDTSLDMIKNNPEVFAALVAALGIAGGILGNWISAKVQATGGRAQAAAAVDAARIATEAQRLATLREDRKIQIAAFVRLAREVLTHTEFMFVEEGRLEPAKTGWEELMQLEGQLELVAPDSVLDQVRRVVDAVGKSMELAILRAPAARARRKLSRVHPGDSAYEAARRAWNCLEELREAYAAGDGNTGEQNAFHSAAVSALAAIETFTAAERQALVFDATLPPADEAQNEIATLRNTAVRNLVAYARVALGADES